MGEKKALITLRQKRGGIKTNCHPLPVSKGKRKVSRKVTDRGKKRRIRGFSNPKKGRGLGSRRVESARKPILGAASFLFSTAKNK